MTAQVSVPIGDVDLAATLGSLAWLAGDPTLRCTPGRFERATTTPDGPAAVEVARGTARFENKHLSARRVRVLVAAVFPERHRRRRRRRVVVS